MAKKNYLIEGGSCTGKSSVYRELVKRGYKAVDGDNQIAYKGDPETGEPKNVTGFGDRSFKYHIWDVNTVREIVASKDDEVIFFCGGSRNFHKFIDLFDIVFILDIDTDTLKKRLEKRDADDWGGNDEQKDFIVRLHATKETIPGEGIIIDTSRPIEEVVDAILECTNA